VGCSITCLRKLKLAGSPDPFWLAIAGQKNWMVFSHNKKILTVPEERETIIREKVGIVFLTNGIEHPRAVLRLLLSKWDALETLWNTVDRPFARFLSPNGRLTSKYKHYELS
jgi:hypothetical protein